MSIKIKDIQMHVLNMRTRMPFNYGIASLVALPHLFVRAEVEVDGKTSVGVSADGLPPKWFTKHPDSLFLEDLDEMLAVIRNAVDLALSSGKHETVFDLWHSVYGEQSRWAEKTQHPPLLWGFGVSLVERATIDAFCRAKGGSFREILHANALGIRLGAIHPELEGEAPGTFLPEHTLDTVIARHTVGLADPLTDTDIKKKDRLNDGLPQSLEASVKAYGLTHLKIKLCGDARKDLKRLEQIAKMMSRQRNYAFTLDGNEQYTDLEPFRTLWDKIVEDGELSHFLEHLLFVEQPFHRDVALTREIGEGLKAWDDRPPMVIDESDSRLESAREALDLGYVGTSHKNCKGVIKGVANACLMAHRRVDHIGQTFILSGEDLANVGPVAMLQDLAVLAALGITHAERNGHHYFKGLSMYPEDVQAEVVARHGTLYRRHEEGFPTLAIRNGKVYTSSVNDAPFGYNIALDTTQFTPLAAWSADSLEL